MECISSGSLVAVQIVTAVVANLISFMALMALINGLVVYAGTLLGQPHWNLELIFGYAFFPIAYMIGVTENLEETMIVARLIGVKIIINDFIAYKRLGDVLREDSLSPRSVMIVTYALCSFSDFIAAGIQMAVLSEMAPSRKQLISKLVLRALFAGCVSCFMSAAIAGILIDEPVACKPKSFSNGKCFDLNVHQTFMERIMANNNSLF
ncbi:hypothetical protein Mgra_00009475 [Meloidogyne graminicola]|nr:hypothetical protein Mgra_00009475 [Meloidogyne graminicola]